MTSFQPYTDTEAMTSYLQIDCIGVSIPNHSFLSVPFHKNASRLREMLGITLGSPNELQSALLPYTDTEALRWPCIDREKQEAQYIARLRNILKIQYKLSVGVVIKDNIVYVHISMRNGPKRLNRQFPIIPIEEIVGLLIEDPQFTAFEK